MTQPTALPPEIEALIQEIAEQEMYESMYIDTLREVAVRVLAWQCHG